MFAWFRTRRSAVDERFKTGSDRMNRHETRISKLESEVLAMPGKDDMHQLQMELVKQTGSLDKMQAVMDGGRVIVQSDVTVAGYSPGALGIWYKPV